MFIREALTYIVDVAHLVPTSASLRYLDHVLHGRTREVSEITAGGN